MIKNIKYILLLVVIIIIALFFFFRNKSNQQIEYQSSLIEIQLKNVSKLVVSEGNYSEIMSFKDQQNYMMDMISFEKKAMMVVNAKVTVSYDLKKMVYKIDKDSKTIEIVSIPQEEINISPDIKFYDVEQSIFNPFTGDDFNKISAKVKKDLATKIDSSPQKANAENRLISELSNLFFLTKDLGWTLTYKGQEITNQNELKNFKN
jgi:ATP-dependent Zn protease